MAGKRLAQALGFMLGCIVDFVADDACHVCGRPYRFSPATLAEPAAALAGAVRIGPVTNHPVCERCASRLVSAAADTIAGWRLPGGAVLTRTHDLVPPPPGVNPAVTPGPLRLVSAFHTNDVLLKLMHALKFSRVTSLIPGLSGAVAPVAEPCVRGLHRPVLVAVPMDARSRRRRGFNQSEAIAGELSRRWGIPQRAGVVLKPAATPPQSLARRDQRLRNVVGAFVPGPVGVEDRDVILVDDLVTTGATAAAVAAVLGAAGAATVTVVCVGRAL